MKLIPLLAISAATLALAACQHDRPRGYGYHDRTFIEGGRGYRDRDRYRHGDGRYERSRYDGRRQDERHDGRQGGSVRLGA
ncbi:hypothetical protein ACIKTA_06315, partial [Hansschlegelia beijingensis]